MGKRDQRHNAPRYSACFVLPFGFTVHFHSLRFAPFRRPQFNGKALARYFHAIALLNINSLIRWRMKTKPAANSCFVIENISIRNCAICHQPSAIKKSVMCSHWLPKIVTLEIALQAIMLHEWMRTIIVVRFTASSKSTEFFNQIAVKFPFGRHGMSVRGRHPGPGG